MFETVRKPMVSFSVLYWSFIGSRIVVPSS